jgi:hypothetical protein
MAEYAAPSLMGAGAVVAGYTLGGIDLVLESLMVVMAAGLLLRLLWRRGKSLKDI